MMITKRHPGAYSAVMSVKKQAVQCCAVQLYSVVLCSCTVLCCAAVQCCAVQLYSVVLCSCTVLCCAAVQCCAVQLQHWVHFCIAIDLGAIDVPIMALCLKLEEKGNWKRMEQNHKLKTDCVRLLLKRQR